MKIEIIQASSAHATVISDIARETFAMAGPPEADAVSVGAYVARNLSEACFRRIIAIEQYFVSCAVVDGETAGFLVLKHNSPCSHNQLEEAAELQKLYVRPTYHGAGVSHKLLLGALDAASKTGARHVWLGVYSGNTRAKRFYAKFGFVDIADAHFHMGNEIHLDRIMVANIT